RRAVCDGVIALLRRLTGLWLPAVESPFIARHGMRGYDRCWDTLFDGDPAGHRRAPCRMEKVLGHAGNGGILMATPHQLCPVCSRPVTFGAYRILQGGGPIHLSCQVSPRSVNTWPGGSRELLCLKCGLAFQSDSKAQRLCGACGGRSF